MDESCRIERISYFFELYEKIKYANSENERNKNLEVLIYNIGILLGEQLVLEYWERENHKEK